MMRRLTLASLTCALLLTSAPSAFAHRLKLFATLEGDMISGFAFFIGAGRAQDAEIAVRDDSGSELARLRTDGLGAFSWRATIPQTYRLTVDAGDGHVAEAAIDGQRFSGASSSDGLDETVPAPSSAITQAQIERAVDAAVARQMRPLLEAYEKAEARLRFNDIMGGIGMIIGLAGLALWMSARRRRSS